MSLIELLQYYGLWGVLLGTFFEGEAILLIAGGLAREHLLSASRVWLVGALGAYVGHLVFYALGRYMHERDLLAWLPRWRPKIDRALSLLQTHPTLSIFLLQYLYGMRIVGAVAIGLAGMPWPIFAGLELINCFIWSGVIFGLGYSATELALHASPLIPKSLSLLFAVAVVVGLVYWLVRGERRLEEKPDSKR